MSRLCKLSIGVACSVGVIVLALAPSAALAKNGGGSSMGSSHSSGPSMSKGFSGVSKSVGNYQLGKTAGNLPISKNIGNLPISKNLGKLPINKVGGNLPISKNIGKLPKIDPGKGNGKVDPIKKGPKFDFCKDKYHYCDPCHHDFCHHDFCCHPCWHWSFPWLLPTYCQEVVCIQTVYAEPLYTLFYETPEGIKVYSRYELPSETATLYKTEHMLDASKTAWWLISTAGQLVDTNTAEKVVGVSATAAVSQ